MGNIQKLVLALLSYSVCVYQTEEAEFEGCNLGDVSQQCNSTVRQYYFDPIDGSCQMLPLGRCQEPGFVTKLKCMMGCAGTKCPVCNLPKSHGPCQNNTRKYHYNIKTCQCEKFVYGGCDGNSNRFDSIEGCENACGDFSCPVCNLPKEKGSCKGMILKWYFDDITCTCRSFIYSGCDGNNNRYYSKLDCDRACYGAPCRKSTCIQEVDEGPCNLTLTRYFFNATSKNCEAFTWGGCQPNGNNFLTKRYCKKKCINNKTSPPTGILPLG